MGPPTNSVLRRTSANMPRVRWCSVSFMCIIFVFFWIASVTADCWFENESYEESNEVPTAEPCLNCTCRQGALVCYLRVCSKLPDPPPPGCIILHRHRTCCSELVCSDIASGNRIEARSEPDQLNVDFNQAAVGDACVENGTIYGSGSAMGSSTYCEYCYCIGGQQTCIKPRCLLSLDGCTPQYEAYSCCPVRYDCAEYYKSIGFTSSTTTQKPKDVVVRGGCFVAGVYYTEGSRVLGVGHSVCDNCYCVRGMLRCEPLSCAPPILGCNPVIKPGECCAASYNCNGTIDIDPEPNYGQFPTVSKEYAKLRKEVQQPRRPTPSKFEKRTELENSNGTYYVIAESKHTSTTLSHRNIGSFGTTRHILDPSTKGPFYYHTSPKQSTTDTNPDSAVDIRARPSTLYRKNNSYRTTNYDFQNNNFRIPPSTTNIPKSTASVTTPKHLRSSDYEDGLNDDVIFSLVDSLFDNEINKNILTSNLTSQNSSVEPTTYKSEDLTTTEQTKVTASVFNLTDVLTTLLSTLTENGYSTTLDFSNLTTVSPGITVNEDEGTILISESTEAPAVETKTQSYMAAITALVTTTDCLKSNDSTGNVTKNDQIGVVSLTPTEINDINNELDEKLNNNKLWITTTTTEERGETSTVTTTENDIAEVDLESKVKVDAITEQPLLKHSSEIQHILNITINQDYEDYDYNEPTLPPSLPNLRIIPFVAADALDTKQREDDNAVYPLSRERITDPPPYNLFSPPTKTEGGFVPKEPPLLHEYYNNFHSTRIDITSVSPTITNPSKSYKHNCIADDREIRHGETVKAESCIICVCLYGNIACQQPQCPQPSPGCKRSTQQEKPTCCPQLICDTEEAPTVVLDRMDVTSNLGDIVTIAQKSVTPDPFRDVIRTKPAPNLQSLMGDMMPYLARHSTTHKITTEATTETLYTKSNSDRRESNNTEREDEELSFQKVLELLLYGETTTEKQRKFVQTPPTVQYHSSSTTEYLNSESRETSNTNNLNSVESAAGVGLLKLAGCNIYGRMYRVGRIISELSGPCVECKCTEIGVQCTPLKC